MSDSNGKEKSGSKSVPMMPGKNGGMLRRGSAKGNTPGTGRPPSALRAKMREVLSEKGFGVLEDAMTSEQTADQLRAVDIAAKYGLGSKGSYDRELIDSLTNALAEVLFAHQDGTELMKQVHDAWVPILAKAIKNG